MADAEAITRKRTPKPSGSAAVDDFLRTSEHPLKPEMEALRAVILGVDPRIGEEIKWKAPSFKLEEHFATFNLRGDAILVILHFGAKVNALATTGVKINDPTGLLKWLAKDRASVTFKDQAALEAGREAFANILRQWITYLA